MTLGFSTGSLAKGDFKLALAMLQEHQLDAIELSALREAELPELLSALDQLELSPYKHVTIHAPSKLLEMSEGRLISILEPLTYPVVVHPDIIKEPSHWNVIGKRLLIENMDKRKPIGRTAKELDAVFSLLPEARLCLDVGHSKQIDPSLHETNNILKIHGHRLAEVHLSEVNSASGHERLNRMAIEDFQKIARGIPPEIPIILETPVSADEIGREIEKAREVFAALELVSS